MSQKMKDFDEATSGSGDAPTGNRNITLMTDLIKRAESMTTDVAAAIDPRRGREIHREMGDIKNYLYIDGVMWAEVQWSQSRKTWCIQDCCGYCLSHIEHFHVAVKGDKEATREQAISLAEDMIRDGRMPSPEQARKEFEKRRGS